MDENFKHIMDQKKDGTPVCDETQLNAEKPEKSYEIRIAREQDIPAIVKIGQDLTNKALASCVRSWMTVDPVGIKVAVSESGEVIGVASCVHNGDGIYYGGLYTVKEEYRNRGAGVELFMKCREDLGDNQFSTTALPAMAEVYKKHAEHIVEPDWKCLKSYTESKVNSAALSSTLPPGVEIRPFQKDHIGLVCAYDSALVGFNRTFALELSCKEANCKTLIALKDETCVGFGAIKFSCEGASRVGPLYADDPSIAEVLLKLLIESYPEMRSFTMTTIDSNVAANNLLAKIECPPAATLIRGYIKRRLTVDTSKVFAFFDVSFTPF